MFEKNLKIALLQDYYGELLDEHTRSVMRAYYEDDLSLSEIADGLGISRQGVRHIVKKGEDLLEFYDSRLGLSRLYTDLDEARERLFNLLSSELVSDEVRTELSVINGLISDK